MEQTKDKLVEACQSAYYRLKHIAVNEDTDSHDEVLEELSEAIKSADDEARQLEKAHRVIKMLCESLNYSHDELMRKQGATDEQCMNLDWPEWSHMANSIRAAEELLGVKLAKTDLWTLHKSG